MPCGGWGQGLGEHDPPSVHVVPAPVHCDCTTWVHPPVEATQQVPKIGWGQGFGVHEPPWVQTLVAPVHWNWATNEHVPVNVPQQVPDGGCGHGFGEHMTFSVQTFGDAQFACVVNVQTPVVEQHEPCGGRQGFTGWQVRPAVHVLPAEHVA